MTAIYSAIGPVAIHLPETVETNEQLQREYPRWDMELIYSKTGIASRHIAAADETAADLGVAAAEKLFAEQGVDRESIDFLMFCTQSPDYPLPTSACLMQHRLGLRKNVGALDFNLGCSGFVYGLALADGLIRGGMARRVLLITGETYSKYIHHNDRSLRTIFGDAGAATIVEASDTPSLGSFVFGTDGAGGDLLVVGSGGSRPQEKALKPRKRPRWGSPLCMDGPALVDFAIDSLPGLVDGVLAQAKQTKGDVDLFVVHQATRKLLDHVREKIAIPDDKFPFALEQYGNTVSSTIPILIRDLRADGRLTPGKKTLLIGFGVGLSWAGCAWTETWSAKAANAAESTGKNPDDDSRFQAA